MEALEIVLIILFTLVCLLLVVAVLLQNNKGSGLSGMLGGASTQTPFGASAVDVMGRITQWLGAAFFLICLGFSAVYFKKPVTSKEAQTIEAPANAKAAEPAAATDDKPAADTENKIAPKDEPAAPAAPANPAGN